MPPEKRTGKRLASLTEVWRIELARGLRSLASGDFEAAEARFVRAHRHAPDRPEVCFALGRERFRQGNLVEAETLLRAAWGERKLAVAAGALARCLSSAGRRPEAFAVLDDALEALGEVAPLLVVRADLHLDAEDVTAARACLDRATEIVDRGAGEAKLLGKRAGAATRDAIATGHARAHNLDGIALGKAGRTEEALFAFKRAFDLEPAWAGPLVNMGAVFARLGRTARARACYERALVMDPTNVVARYNVALAARERGDLDRALADYRRVLELDDDYPGVRLALAEVLIERGQPAPAAALLEEQLSRVPGDVTVLYHLGVACELLGDETRAEARLREALVADEEHIPALCRLAGVLGRRGQVIAAAELVRRARGLDAERASRYLGARDGVDNPQN
jgi:tetratricopeptide (TPR) repeat protein